MSNTQRLWNHDKYKNPSFLKWKTEVHKLAEKEALHLPTDDEEVLYNYFKAGDTPAYFLDKNSIPW